MTHLKYMTTDLLKHLHSSKNHMFTDFCPFQFAFLCFRSVWDKIWDDLSDKQTVQLALKCTVVNSRLANEAKVCLVTQLL